MGEQAYANFERDIPAVQQEDIMTMMAEAAHDDGAHKDTITILERDKINAINVRVNGIVTLDGREFSFILRDGDIDGTVLEDWEGDTVFEYHTPTVWAVQPRQDIIYDAIRKGQGPFLILKWDAMVKNRKLDDAVRAYSYDRHFHPGGLIENHYRNKVAEFGFVIVTKDEADETRACLAVATEPESPNA